MTGSVHDPAIGLAMANSFLNELLQTLSERGRGLLGRSRGAPRRKI